MNFTQYGCEITTMQKDEILFNVSVINVWCRVSQSITEILHFHKDGIGG